MCPSPLVITLETAVAGASDDEDSWRLMQDFRCLVNDLWRLAHDLWCLVHNSWHLVHDS